MASVVIEKRTVKALKHVAGATGTERPAYAHLYQLDQDTLAATDGVRIAAARVQIAPEGQVFCPTKLPTQKDQTMEHVNSDTDFDLPRAMGRCLRRVQLEPVTGRIVLNADLLRKALDGLNGPVVLTLHGRMDAIELQGMADDNVQTYDAIMPMRLRSTDDWWRPDFTDYKGG